MSVNFDSLKRHWTVAVSPSAWGGPIAASAEPFTGRDHQEDRDMWKIKLLHTVPL